MLHTILGSTGVIGRALASSLPAHRVQGRLVSRNPRHVNPSDELLKADLLDPAQTRRAIEGSAVVYLTAGLRYHTPTWQQQWPVVMRNVIEGCKSAGAKLVFFDNVYAYGPVRGWMTEETPMNPSSRKGEVRRVIADMIMEEVTAGKLQALIARAADFYGPNTPLSFVHALVFERLAKGKKAQWMVNPAVRHSFTYTPDAGRATAMLGNTESAYGQVWHLPTHREALTGAAFIGLAAKELNGDAGVAILGKGMIRLAGLFVEAIRESREMLYQYEEDYLFDSTKFEKAFGFTPTTYEAGIRETARAMRGG
jgi:nucleoside-diphosphate-sugar epimerase